MSETLIGYLASYGTALIFIATMLSCLAVPIPTSLLMLTAGAFAATGDLSLSAVAFAAVIGAVLGDQIGYQLGKRAAAPLRRFMEANAKRQKLLHAAESYLSKWGGIGVFLSRWLVSPLGPYVNFTAGATALPWPVFSIAGLFGEITWVAIYVGLGYAFADNLTMAADLASSVLGLLAALACLIGFGAWLVHHNKRRKLPLPDQPTPPIS